MKRLSISTIASYILITILLLFTSPIYANDIYTVDPVHSSITFRIKHLGITNVYGRFNQPTGTIVFNEKEAMIHTAEIQVDVTGIDTDNNDRDNHLRSPDFFHAAKYQIIAFKSESIKKIDKDQFEVNGQITLLGVTKSITVVVTHTGAGLDPWGNYRVGFETTFEIKRTDFGMNFGLDMVSDQVRLMVAIEAVRQAK